MLCPSSPSVARRRLNLCLAAGLLLGLPACEPVDRPAPVSPTGSAEGAPAVAAEPDFELARPEPSPGRTAAEPALSEPRDPGPTESFPTFGLAFTPPDGWRAERERLPFGFLGRCLPSDGDPDDWSQFAVDLRTLVGSAEQRAGAYRQAIDRWVRRGYRPTEFDLDGVEAVRLDAPPLAPNAERRPVPSPILITRRSRMLYRTLFLLNDPSRTPEVDRLVRGWRWIEPTAVAQHLELSEPQPLFDGLGEIRVPAIARIDPEFSSEDSAGYTVYDYQHWQDALILVCERDLDPDPALLREHVVSYAKSIEGRAELGEPLSFSQAEGRRDLYTSEPIEGRFEEGGRTVRRLCRYAVWRPKGGVLVRLQAVINNEVFTDKQQLAQAVRAVDGIFASCSERPDGGAD